MSFEFVAKNRCIRDKLYRVALGLGLSLHARLHWVVNGTLHGGGRESKKENMDVGGGTKGEWCMVLVSFRRIREWSI